MKKKRRKGNIIIISGIISIIIITIITFSKDNILYQYYKYNITKNYSNINENNYFLKDNFNYVENYTKPNIKNKQDLINSIYYSLNSGIKYTEKYIDKDYTNFINDIDNITNNEKEKLQKQISLLNNFVHPYNSSNNINLTYGNKYMFSITVNKAYTNKEIDEINTIVDKIINEKINNNMSDREKIKIIHDYIINNTEYDILKNNNINDTTYKSNTAYGALIEGYATCNGYSDAMAIFLNKLDIINYKISNDKHIWNLVYIDGKWYHLDLTWDDPISSANTTRDTYFLITTKELEEINDDTHKYEKTIYSEAS